MPPSNSRPLARLREKIVDDKMQIVQIGTSSLTPKELADSWEAAAVASNDLNHGRLDFELDCSKQSSYIRVPWRNRNVRFWMFCFQKYGRNCCDCFLTCHRSNDTCASLPT
jgi:hypothetical protein